MTYQIFILLTIDMPSKIIWHFHIYPFSYLLIISNPHDQNFQLLQ